MITEGRTCFQRGGRGGAELAPGNRRRRPSAALRRRVDRPRAPRALRAFQIFQAIGGYDESFVANEDAELDARLASSGGRIWLADELAITYRPRATARALFTQYLRYGAGRAQTLLRHRARPKLRQLLPTLVAPAVVLLAPALLVPLLAAPAALWAALCVLYGLVLGARNRSLCAAAAGAAAMIMHLAWSIGFWGRVLSGRGRAKAEPAASPQ